MANAKILLYRNSLYDLQKPTYYIPTKISKYETRFQITRDPRDQVNQLPVEKDFTEFFTADPKYWLEFPYYLRTLQVYLTEGPTKIEM